MKPEQRARGSPISRCCRWDPSQQSGSRDPGSRHSPALCCPSTGNPSPRSCHSGQSMCFRAQSLRGWGFSELGACLSPKPRLPAGGQVGGGGEAPALPLPGGKREWRWKDGGGVEAKGREGGGGPRPSLSLGTGWRPGPPFPSSLELWLLSVRVGLGHRKGTLFATNMWLKQMARVRHKQRPWGSKAQRGCRQGCGETQGTRQSLRTERRMFDCSAEQETHGPGNEQTKELGDGEWGVGNRAPPPRAGPLQESQML